MKKNILWAIPFLALSCKNSPEPSTEPTIEPRRCEQFQNSTFEEVWDENNECTGWHSFGTIMGLATTFAKNTDQSGFSADVRPGSTGVKSARISERNIMGGAVKANGCFTTGRMNAGNTIATNPLNHNATRLDGMLGETTGVVASNPNFFNEMPSKPDSIAVWVKYIPAASSKKARFAIHIHGQREGQLDKIFQDPTPTEKPELNNELIVGSAEINFSATPTKGWQRIAIPFVYNTSAKYTQKYILASFTTNQTPGGGSGKDSLLIDDILLVYNPRLKAQTIKALSAREYEVDYFLDGTVSPYNLNAAANEVIAEISDSNGSFDAAQEIGRKTSDKSGLLSVKLADNIGSGNYLIRLRSTNYPQVSENTLSIKL